jgi:Protein of unknown function (DUF3489)
MNRHARQKRAQKGPQITMTTAESTTPEQAAAVAAQGAHVAPEKATSKKGTTQKKGAPKGPKAAKKAKAAAPKEAKPKKAPKADRTKEAGTLRPESKGAKVLELISRAKGASLAELMKATGWQAHSVRGFISGTLGTKMGLKVASVKREDGERSYSMAK